MRYLLFLWSFLQQTSALARVTKGLRILCLAIGQILLLNKWRQQNAMHMAITINLKESLAHSAVSVQFQPISV